MDIHCIAIGMNAPEKRCFLPFFYVSNKNLAMFKSIIKTSLVVRLLLL